MVELESTSGTSPKTMRRARPSAMAVFADPGVADEQGIVLVAPAEDLDGALDFPLPADQGVDAAFGRLLVEVDAVGFDRLVAGPHHVVGIVIIFGAVNGVLPRPAGHLGDAMGDVIDGVQPRHVMDLQEVDGVGFPFREQGNQEIGPGHFLAARRLHMDDGALDHTLKARRGLRLGPLRPVQGDELGFDEFGQVPAKFVQVDAAGAEHGHRVLVIGEGQQQVLEGGVFMPALGGQGQGPMQGLLEIAGQHS